MATQKRAQNEIVDKQCQGGRGGVGSSTTTLAKAAALLLLSASSSSLRFLAALVALLAPGVVSAAEPPASSPVLSSAIISAGLSIMASAAKRPKTTWKSSSCPSRAAVCTRFRSWLIAVGTGYAVAAAM